VNHPQIAAFARLAKENTPPTRTIIGQKTLISRTMHAFEYDALHDEIVVPSPLAQAILVFRGGANGEEAPVRYIQGPRTQIVGTGYGALDAVHVDPVNNEIYLPIARDSVLVFDRTAHGDVAPKRVLGGPDTQIRFPKPDQRGGLPNVAVDPVHNLLIVPTRGGIGENTPASLLIFDRTASGNAKPLRVISGPNTELGGGKPHIYAPKGWIIASAAGGAIGVWHINDSGNVPPRWRIPVTKITGMNVNGVEIDPEHKEIMVPTGNGNTVFTFYFPEIFE
jgi:hypothetical protein